MKTECPGPLELVEIYKNVEGECSKHVSKILNLPWHDRKSAKLARKSGRNNSGLMSKEEYKISSKKK